MKMSSAKWRPFCTGGNELILEVSSDFSKSLSMSCDIVSDLQTAIKSVRYLNTVRSRYNAVNFLPNPHKIQPIAPPLGRGMVSILWVQTLTYTLCQ